MVEVLFDNLPLLLLAAGLVLMALEALSPGAHFVVIGVALVGAGLFGLLLGPVLGGLSLVLALAVVTLVVGGAATWVYREFDIYGGKGTAQTRDSASLAGSTGYATETITARSGEVKLDSGGFAPYYSARTTNGTIEEGEEIIVLDPGGGNVLTVASMETLEEDEIDRALAREAAKRAEEDRESDGGDAGESVTETETETEKSG
ncbi:NfeD family protein [Salinilacihabitans rarus]|uniref:NfeD family protein n=1 Tax=Salinilacihabitans rarus TaxID=2961596 RepID=UPI0020C90FB2|nr:NfeD family protein [Salinilacihabitans rarus]